MDKSSKKILIIEDEETLLKALVSKFKSKKLLVLQAKNGQEGLLIAQKENPDLILLDIVMPVMDGITMLKQLREKDWGKEIPVIVLTNLNDSQKVSEAMTRGVHDYLVKTDWKLDDLAKKVDERLKQ